MILALTLIFPSVPKSEYFPATLRRIAHLFRREFHPQHDPNGSEILPWHNRMERVIVETAEIVAVRPSEDVGEGSHVERDRQIRERVPYPEFRRTEASHGKEERNTQHGVRHSEQYPYQWQWVPCVRPLVEPF